MRSCHLSLGCVLAAGLLLLLEPSEARIKFMTKLKLLALLAMTKKVQVVPVPLPIPIPIQLSAKDEFYYLDPPPPMPYHYGSPPRYQQHMGYSASELLPVTMAPDQRPLRFGDRIVANKSTTESTYRIRKVVRNRQPESSTTVPSPPTTTAGDTVVTEPTVATTTEATNNDAPLELKDIKLIFIPVKNMATTGTTSSGLSQSDMSQLSQQVAKQLSTELDMAKHSHSEVSSLQAQWQQQNSNVPRAPYYRAPELKVIRTRPYHQSQEYRSARPSSGVGRGLEPRPIQFLYQVSHQQQPPPLPYRPELWPGASNLMTTWAEPPPWLRHGARFWPRHH